MKWTNGKKAVAIIAGIAIIAVISVLCGIVYYGVMRSKYNNVVEMIKQGNYETAEEMLIDMNVIGTKNDEKMADFIPGTSLCPGKYQSALRPDRGTVQRCF